MADDPIRTAAAAENGLVKDTLLEATVKRTIYVLDVGEAWGDFDQSVGEKRLAILDAATSYLYLYDATDTTTADDGLTCRVTGTGERYHIEDAASVSISSVLASQNSPPGSPANHDPYIVGTSPTGAWAAQATNIAIYTRRGWVFAEPEIGMTVYNQATGANLQFDENGDWVDFGSELPDDSVLPVQLAFPAGVSVEAQQNAPPSVPSDPGILYLVGTSGSGAWSGHNNAFAFSRDATTWEFIAAYEGATVWNKATDVALRYNGTAWVSTSAGIISRQVFTTAGAATWTRPPNAPASAMALIEMWGGGAGGGSISDQNVGGGGGGGGAYVFAWVLVSTLGSTESLNIGAGGAAGGSGLSGGNGGNSTFGTLLTALGGTRGTGNLGGGGDSAGGALSGNLGAPGGNGGGSGGNGTSGVWPGGGGGGGSTGAATTGGTSKFGGSGGAGGGSGGNGSAGTAPGGGGGGSGAVVGATRNGGAGARGEIRVTVFA